MSVSEQEIALSAEMMYLEHTQGGYGPLSEAGRGVREYWREMAIQAASILRPDGSELYCRCGNPWPTTPCGTACHARPK